MNTSNIMFLQSNEVLSSPKDVTPIVDEINSLSKWQLNNNAEIRKYNNEEYVWYGRHEDSNISIDAQINLEEFCYQTITNLIPGKYRFSFQRISGVGGNASSRYRGWNIIYTTEGEQVSYSYWYDAKSVQLETQYCQLNVYKNGKLLYDDKDYTQHNLASDVSTRIQLTSYDRWNKTFAEPYRSNTYIPDSEKLSWYGNLGYCMNIYNEESLSIWSKKFSDNFKSSCEFNISNVSDEIKIAFVNSYARLGTGVEIAIKNIKLEYI